MKILLLGIAIILLSLVGYHWADLKRIYNRFNNMDDQALVLTVKLIGCFLAIAFVFWGMAY